MHITPNAYVPARARLASAIASVVITTTLIGSVMAGFDFKASAGALSAAQASATVTGSRVSTVPPVDADLPLPLLQATLGPRSAQDGSAGNDALAVDRH